MDAPASTVMGAGTVVLSSFVDFFRGLAWVAAAVAAVATPCCLPLDLVPPCTPGWRLVPQAC